MQNPNHYVAIMAGGIGSRFWPMSKPSFPKQFLDILNTGQTLIQSTYARFATFIPKSNIYVVTSQAYVSIVQTQLPHLPSENIIAEPERKNTAACVAYISFKLKKLNPNANLIIAPSDHLIGDLDKFTSTCLEGLRYTAQHDAFVTMGIRPTHPNTGYGYIQHGSKASGSGILPVERFTEKPDKQTAVSFLSAGNFLWNSGIFIWKAADILDGFEIHAPHIFHAFEEIYAALNSPEEALVIAQAYAKCQPISVDYAIMEKAENVWVIPADFTWNDLGTWNSAWEYFQKDEALNACNNTSAVLVDSQGCLVHTHEQKVMVLGGLDNMIVINTPDALLICKKENEQQIKHYLQKATEAQVKRL